MEKNIKDYLHLYLGCDVQWTMVAGEVGKLVGISKSEVEPDKTIAIIGGNVFQEWYIDEVKPILRPLSDMTDEKAKELGKLLHTGVIIGSPYKINHFWRVPYGVTLTDYWEIDGDVFNQHQTIYLLSKHFDLFGLIEAGLAIDKTTLKE